MPSQYPHRAKCFRIGPEITFLRRAPWPDPPDSNKNPDFSSFGNQTRQIRTKNHPFQILGSNLPPTDSVGGQWFLRFETWRQSPNLHLFIFASSVADHRDRDAPIRSWRQKSTSAYPQTCQIRTKIHTFQILGSNLPPTDSVGGKWFLRFETWNRCVPVSVISDAARKYE